MHRVFKGFAAELMPQWMKKKGRLLMPKPDPNSPRPAKPASRWGAEVEKTPLDPKEHADDFDKNKDDVGKRSDDPRRGSTPKP
jgi:hypothetical protein